MIAIIDYDIGNLGAVANMLNRIGARCEITADPDRIEQAERIILPGNGAFDACMRSLRSTGLIPLLERRVLEFAVPLLGICVGAQMLGHDSEEGSEPGLGWLETSVRRLPVAAEFPVPHMGWNQVTVQPEPHRLTEGIGTDARFYFTHSYYIHAREPADVILTTSYGMEFAAAVAHGNIAGVQFHPEKSHRFGKRLLGNFAGLS